jgi:hypothetical protein
MAMQTHAAPLLTKAEVVERVQRLDQLIARERSLKEMLLELKMTGRSEDIAAKKQRHDEAIAEIEHNRMEVMLPLIKELHAFTRAAKAILGEA